jgi:O-antigen/teichoic acid export membrane protein
MATPAYDGAIRLVPLLALAAGVYGLYFLVGIGASRVKRTGWHAAVAFGAVGVSLVANLVLVPALGVMGAAVSAVIANAALAGFMLVRSQHVFPVQYELGRLARAALVVCIGVSAAYALPTGTDWSSWSSRIAVVVALPLLLMMSGFATPQERERIVRLARRRRGGAAS